MFDEVKALLREHRRLRTTGMMVGATIIGAPSSPKTATKTRDPEMRQTRNGNQWYFGMMRYVGIDARGVMLSLMTTDAATVTSPNCRSASWQRANGVRR